MSDTNRLNNRSIECKAKVVFALGFIYLSEFANVVIAVLYFNQDHVIWGSLTISLIVLPSIAIQAFSGRWYIADKMSHSPCCWFTHLLQLQPLERYVRVLAAGIKARRCKTAETIDRYYYQQNDVCMLRLFEAFLESAPQLTLQLYIILCTDSANWLTGTSACISLLALGWALASYSHALRQAYQEQYAVHAPTLLLQTVWHVAVVGVRVCSVVAFAAIFKHWVFVALGVHWVAMTIWVMIQGTDFCPTKVEEKLFDCVVGVIYCYTFFNLKEGRTRWRALAFYTLMFLENGTALALWYVYKSKRAWFDPLIVSVAACVFVFGVSCMLLYYRFCHPSGPIACCSVSSEPKEQFQHHSTPDFTKHFQSKNPSKATLAPQYTSTVQLPRRTFLKLQSSKLNVQYKEVCTPSGLSPIKVANSRFRSNNRSGYDTSLQLDDNSAFQHYSIDATAGLMPPSRVATLQGRGIDLSSDGPMLDPVDSYIQLNSEEVTESPSVGKYLSPVKFRNKSSDQDSALFDQNHSRHSHNGFDGCPCCNKGYRYIDQSYESLGNRTVGYCHCTLSEDQWLELGCHQEVSEASQSSGFHSTVDGQHLEDSSQDVPGVGRLKGGEARKAFV